MKKYFAKYLPIEGEITVGDQFLSAWRKEHKFFWYPTADYITDTHYIWGNQPYAKEDAVTKVKLFLCSRDIQVGDGIKLEPLVSEPDYPINTEEEAAHWRNVKEAFKVIGEISPKAVWVKQGDEFEEDEVRPSARHYSSKTRTYRDVFYILCPTCKTYH